MSMMLVAQKYIIRLGLVVSSIFFTMGFPCSDSAVPTILFRITCAGYFFGNLGAAMLGPGQLRRYCLRLAMVSNSLASLVISMWWCMGFGEWAIMQFLEGSFQVAGAIFLLESNIVWHPVLTLSFSTLCFVNRYEAKAPDLFSSRLWISIAVASVMGLVVGMGASGFLTIGALRKKLQTLYQVLTEDMSGFAAEQEEGEHPMDLVPQIHSPSSRRKFSSSASDGTTAPRDKGVYRTGDSADSSESMAAEGSTRRSRCPFDDVALHKKIGRGSFGTVYYATQDKSKPVAVKVIPPRFDFRQKSSSLREARVALGLVHPNVVQTFKYCAKSTPQPFNMLGDDENDDEVAEEAGAGAWITDPEELKEAEAKIMPLELWIVQEWCDRGTLGSFCTNPMETPEEITEACQIMGDIASGGRFLHERDIIHGDLTSNNVLISSTKTNKRGYTCKVCDFGLARVLEGHSSAIFTTTMGTVTHMPPELFQMEKGHLRLSKKADVYASGVLMWQVFSGKPPFGSMHAPHVILFVAKGRRLKLDEKLPQALHDLYNECVEQDPRSRPTLSEVCDRLQAIPTDD